MGIAAKTIAFRFDEQDRRRLHEIQDAFAPFLRTASDVARFCLELVHSLIFGNGTLIQVCSALQGLRCAISQYEPPAPAPEVDPSFLYMQVMYARMAELDKERFARGRELR